MSERIDHIETIKAALFARAANCLCGGTGYTVTSLIGPLPCSYCADVREAIASLTALQEERERMRKALQQARKECRIIAALVPTSSSGQAAGRCVKAIDAAMEPAPQEGRS